jgi:hypothetical protein
MQRPPEGQAPGPTSGPTFRPAGQPPRAGAGPMNAGSGPRPRPQAGGAYPYGQATQQPPGGQQDGGQGGIWSQQEPPWDGAFPELDPGFKYREPGPGMPGYRGSRDSRYGGEGRR